MLRWLRDRIGRPRTSVRELDELFRADVLRDGPN